LKVSVFKNLFSSKDTPYELTIHDIYQRIKVGNAELISKITKIRKLEKSDAEHDRLKSSLNAIMFNGIFSERNDNSLVEHSGLCVLDFDQYPTKEAMDAERARLIDDKHVMMVFTSPGGNGLKAVISIPKSDKLEHKRRFTAFGKYFQSDYFDVKNSNVSRVCFESYDPKIYFNEFCQVWEGIETDEGYNYTERTPTCVLNDEDKIISLIERFDHGCRFEEGSRNHFVFKLACVMCEYGIDKSTTEQYIWTKYCQGTSFNHGEMVTSINSAYKKATFSTKYFEDKDTFHKVKQKLKSGIAKDDIKKQLGVADDIIDDIKEEIASGDDVFWMVDSKKGIQIEPIKYSEFLVKSGFNKYYPENAERPTFVRVKENKVRLSSTEQIKDYVLNYLLDKNEVNVWNYCSRSPYLFNENHLNMIDSIDIFMLQDTKDSSFIPFKNGVVKVSKNDVKVMSYIDVDGYIWENQIIQRDFTPIKDSTNDFEDFVKKVSANDDVRIMSLETTLGYLIHSFKDKTDQKAIIFNDQEIDDNPNGGSGKSLMLAALSYFRRVVKIDGKSFNPGKSDFVYQRVNLDSQILAFDDVKRNFDFEQLFSIISEGITVNRKNKDEIFIPFERSPKIVITTNYVISGAGSSHDRRRHELEFFQYFHSRRSPLDEYGRLLFDSWGDDDWIRFDNYMIKNLQSFLSNGLTKSISINADAKRFIQSTSKDFYDWTEEGNLALNIFHYNSGVMQQFTSEFNGYKELESRKFLKWVAEYANVKGYQMTKGRNHNGRYFELSIPGVKVEKPKDDIWDELNDKAKEI
jgi:hypothetical protein